MSINILVTEDESIVRKDIEQTLEKDWIQRRCDGGQR